MRFGHEYMKGKDEFWKSVLWSDEAKLELLVHMDVADVWQRWGDAKEVFREVR